MAGPSNDGRGKRKAKSPSKFNMGLIVSIGSLAALIIVTVAWQLHRLQAIDEEEITAKFIDDLDLATKPFDGQRFNYDKIFGDKPVWGTLNSGHYFSMKLASPNSIETSFMWFRNETNSEGNLDIRHLCDQNDRLDFYSWIKHDFYSFGEQVIEDGGHKFRISFLKQNPQDPSWRAKVSVESIGNEVKPIYVLNYITSNHPDDSVVLKGQGRRQSKMSSDEPFIVEGVSRDVGDFRFMIDPGSDRDRIIHQSYLSGYLDKSIFPVENYVKIHMNRVTDNKTTVIALNRNPRTYYDDRSDTKKHNIIVHQILLNPPMSFTVSLLTRESETELRHPDQDYDARLKQRAKEFDEKFKEKFLLNQIDLTGNMSRESVENLSKICLSNMIGSIGHFFGNSIIGASAKNKIARYGPIQLLTGVPSRSFFPRGFLWDEAFHNLLISKWDPDLSNKIIKSWFDIMNTNGWIPREVILGAESMRRVPEEFIVQRISNANPPAMFIVLEKMLDDGLLQESTLKSLYPRLKAWYNWFSVTQSGEKKGTYRWRGRDEISVKMLNPKTLTSGLDDYPRASHPSPSEYHVDLRCWMALAARTLAKLALKQGDREFHELISSEAERLSDNEALDYLHWSEEHRMYCDFGHNTQDVELVRVTKQFHSPDDRFRGSEYLETWERRTKGQPAFGCVPEFGYVSLFPMLMHILDHRSEKLGIILDRLSNVDELWSEFGIRSLSKLSKYYNKHNTIHDKPYWRGAIWINMNYLILASLKHYASLEGPHQARCHDFHKQLRQNLIQNVDSELQRSRYIWENYNDQTGIGQGSHPFTGWSALILLMISS